MTDQNLQVLAEGFIKNVPHVRECGMSIASLRAGDVEVSLPYRDAWLGDPERGVLHTGILSVLVDSASGLAVFTGLPKPEPIATLDLRMDYLRPALRDRELHCRAECYRVTTHIAFVRASVWQDDREQPVALAQLVFMRSSSPRSKQAPI